MMKRKFCTKCNLEFSLTKEYFRFVRTEDRYYSMCKQCERANDRARHERDKEKRNLSSRTYYSENAVKLRAYRKDYLKNNEKRDHAIEYSKKYYQEKRNEIRYKGKIYEDNLRKEWMDLFYELGLTTCKICGFDGNFAAIDIHHLNPEDKTGTLTNYARKKPSILAIEELKKCISLCATCHRLVHIKAIDLNIIFDTIESPDVGNPTNRVK